MPARVEPAEYLTAVADFEAVAGAAVARPAWRAARKRWPQEPRLHLALGNRAHGAGDLRGAVRHYRAGLAHAPADPVLGNNLASVLGELGCTRQARAALDAVQAGLPADNRWRAQLAQTRREIDALPVGRVAACKRPR
jgi:predicted Zn-dependent protease